MQRHQKPYHLSWEFSINGLERNRTRMREGSVQLSPSSARSLIPILNHPPTSELDLEPGNLASNLTSGFTFEILQASCRVPVPGSMRTIWSPWQCSGRSNITTTAASQTVWMTTDSDSPASSLLQHKCYSDKNLAQIGHSSVLPVLLFLTTEYISRLNWILDLAQGVEKVP